MGAQWFTDLAGFYDFYGFVLHCAPDFPPEDFLSSEEQLNLEQAFQLLKGGLDLLSPPLGEEQRKAAVAILDEARTAFEGNDEVRGAQLLRELESRIFQ